MANDNSKVTSIMTAVSGMQNSALTFREKLCESAAAVKDPASFWTSGANEGEHCDVEQMYSWCAHEGQLEKRQEIALPWADGITPEAKERCLSLNIKESKFVLDYVECNTEKFAVCEVKYKTTAEAC
jgi:hypothetical protein